MTKSKVIWVQFNLRFSGKSSVFIKRSGSNNSSRFGIYGTRCPQKRILQYLNLVSALKSTVSLEKTVSGTTIMLVSINDKVYTDLGY